MSTESKIKNTIKKMVDIMLRDKSITSCKLTWTSVSTRWEAYDGSGEEIELVPNIEITRGEPKSTPSCERKSFNGEYI